MEKILEICKDCYKRRPNKRQALSLAFKKSKEKVIDLKKPIIYITFGADQILDVIDLMDICFYEDILKIYSYEKVKEIAERSESCLVYKIFNNWHKDKNYRNKIEIIPYEFPYNLLELIEKCGNLSKIIFYDDTGWFDEKDSKLICGLFKKGLIKENDIIIVTTSLDFMGWINIKDNAIEQYNRHFFGSIEKIEEDAAKENIVDLFIEKALREYNRYALSSFQENRQIEADFIAKIRYQDKNRLTMGLWIYQFVSGSKSLDIPKKFDAEFLHGKEKNIFSTMKIHK